MLSNIIQEMYAVYVYFRVVGYGVLLVQSHLKNLNMIFGWM